MSITFLEVFEQINTYIHKQSDLDLIKKAYEFASLKHQNQFRKSGEAYIIHPLAVTMILAQLHVGPNTLTAGLLHDLVEDTDTTLEDIASMYNPDVASIVDGVTKVSQLVFASLEKKQVATHQKMLLAMSKDIRVIIVKLADRLHNMRTMEFMKPESQIRISRETLEIYAPLAHRLGMFTIKAELEDRSLRYLDPDMYFKINSLIKNKENNQNDIVGVMINEISDYLKKDAPNLSDFSIKGRIKGIYSIYKKMINQNKRFEDIYDVYAIRLIVNEVGECYQCLGIIHSHYTPIPTRIKDYIAVPKANMYQSLHTTIIGKNGQPVEVQIRTHEMDEIAELGVAAHWAYKENAVYSKDKEQFEIAQKLKWYGELLSYSEESQDESEFVESVRGDFLDKSIYVYTPNGEVIDLVNGSTPLDFAYRIHTNLGNTTVGATVNGRIVPLSYELKNGDIVNIRTSKTSYGPSEDWLNIVKTTNAKHKIKAFLNKQNKDILISQGKDNLERELSIRQINLEITDRFVKENFSKNNLSTTEDLYLEIGKGLLSSKTVCNKIVGQVNKEEDALQKQIEKSNKIIVTNSDTGVIVEGLSNPLIKLGNCCGPIPGDKIYGYISKGKGIAVHREGCKNLESLDKKRLLELKWATNIQRKYVAYIKITAQQSPSLLADIINAVSANKMSISSINAVNDENLTTLVKLKLLTLNTLELDKFIINLKKITSVINIERDNQ